MRAEQVTAAEADHAEGPVWWGPWGGLRYVDMLAGDVLTLRDDGSVTRTRVGAVVAALRPRAGGGAVLALERSFALAARDDLTDVRELGEVWTDPAVRFNDGGCDPDGRFYCGSMAYDATPGAAALYRLAPGAEEEPRAVLQGVTVSNGLGFSPDGHLAYYNDTATGRTDVFDYDTVNGLGRRRPFVRFATGAGLPDGLCVDAEGGVWVALWGGSAVHRYAPDGTLDRVVTLTASQVSACVFGGPDLDTLYVTTSRTGLPPGAEPAAGAVFAVRPGVTGLPALPYRG
ncbi:SMP-30/gluconolactonase/LRE family protein [Streptomyces sp. AJS327]|uniref:SMP-30/gluconolactonase/LRE family protein n=1 Tax=Streptomyces sp. AJS327 TaxID=2545265 RepID=UPI0015DDF5C0|nr:SMP-30/gluconolactonase/LRE family protein [Streptomyces sp. AJS327]MBA0052024.1 SMP-30/gluconolactonase/LRE family protein [Streptomyces sp. AJS327]